MQKRLWKLLCIFGLCLSIGVLSCVGGNWGKLTGTQSPTQSELMKNWDDYKVFYRRNLALIFKFKDDKKIILDKRWVEITTWGTLAASRISRYTWVRKIVGQNDQVFGYLVHASSDTANVKIVDADTIQLYYYHHVERCCGP